MKKSMQKQIDELKSNQKRHIFLIAILFAFCLILAWRVQDDWSVTQSQLSHKADRICVSETNYTMVNICFDEFKAKPFDWSYCVPYGNDEWEDCMSSLYPSGYRDCFNKYTKEVCTIK